MIAPGPHKERLALPYKTLENFLLLSDNGTVYKKYWNGGSLG